MRIATYNAEWMTALFDDDDQPLYTDDWSQRYDVTKAQQLDALGLVFQSIDADAIVVIEAPDTSRGRRALDALEAFAARYNLRTREAVMGFPNDTQQEIAMLYDPDVLTARHAPMGAPTGSDGRTDAPRFDGVFRIDLDIDATEDRVVFSKPPMELEVETAAGNRFRLIGTHLKSKAPHGARTRDEAMRQSIANRRKQLAQAIWLRQRIDQHLEAGDPLIVLGDLNDGPGLDEYENLFGRSSVEIILGTGQSGKLYDPHAEMALVRPFSASPTTARFFMRNTKRYMQALLDYIMVSPDLRPKAQDWRIWHPMDDPECWTNDAMCKALLTASDHFPVTLDIDL